MIMYEGSAFKNRVSMVEVDEEGEDYIISGGEKYNKRSSMVSYYYTWDEAYKFLLRKGDERVSVANERLILAQDGLADIILMKEDFCKIEEPTHH